MLNSRRSQADSNGYRNRPGVLPWIHCLVRGPGAGEDSDRTVLQTAARSVLSNSASSRPSGQHSSPPSVTKSLLLRLDKRFRRRLRDGLVRGVTVQRNVDDRCGNADDERKSTRIPTGPNYSAGAQAPFALAFMCRPISSSQHAGNGERPFRRVCSPPPNKATCAADYAVIEQPLYSGRTKIMAIKDWKTKEHPRQARRRGTRGREPRLSSHGEHDGPGSRWQASFKASCFDSAGRPPSPRQLAS